MRRASKLLIACLLLVAIFSATFTGLILSESSAEAATIPQKNIASTVTHEVTFSAAGYAASMKSNIFCDGAGGAFFTVLTLGANQAACAIGGVVIEGISDAANALLDGIAQIGFEAIGGLISWVGNGVVSLVIGMHTECMAGAGGLNPASGTSTSADITQTQANACESRISMDYLTWDVMNAQDRENIQKEGDQFYVPRSPVSTQKWTRDYKKYVWIGVMLMIPMIIAACMQAVITGKPVVMLRSIFLHIPASIFGIAIAPYIVRRFMILIDAWSYYVASDIRSDMTGFFATNNTAVIGTGWAFIFPALICALIFAFAAILIWFVLAMREASVALIAVFLPIAFASSVWPALAKWSLRAIKLLVAAIISKLFIVGALSLGIGTFSGATANNAGGATQFSISHLIYGSTIFFIAAFSPHLVMKFFDEIGDALNAAGGTGALARGLNVGANVNGTKSLVQGMAGGGMGALAGGSSGPGGADAFKQALGESAGGQVLAGGGSMEEAMKAARAGAGGGAAGDKAAASLYGNNGGTGGETGAATMTGSTAADMASERGAGSVEAGVAGGTSAFNSGMSDAQAGQVAYGEAYAKEYDTAKASGMSDADAHAHADGAGRNAQNQTLDSLAPQQASRDREQKDVARATAKASRKYTRGSLYRAAVSPVWGARHALNRPEGAKKKP